MKKLVLGAAAIVLAGGIVACGPTSKPTETPTDVPTSTPAPAAKDVNIKVWGPDAEQTVYDWAVETYNASQDDYNVTITFEAIGEDKADTEMTKNIQDGATLYFYADDKTLNFLNTNSISPVVGANATYVEDNCTEGAVAAATMGGQMVAYPVSVDNLWFAYYDNSFYSAEDVKSLETILSKAHEAGKKVYLPVNTGWYILPSFYSNVELYWTMGADGKLSFTTTLDSAEAIAQSEYINGLLTTYIKNGTLNIGQAMGGESGSVYTLDGAWNYSNDKGTGYFDVLGENLTLTTTPTYKVGDRTVQMKSFLGSKLLGVNAAHDEDKVTVGHEIAKILISKEGALRRYEARQSIPTNVEALEDARFTGNVSPTVTAIQNQSALGGFSQAATVQGSDLWDIFENALGKGLAGNGSENDPETGLIADWAAYLATQANRIRALSI